MRVLISGSAGFIGSHLTDRLIADGHEVTAWDLLTTGRVEQVNPSADFHKINVARIDPTMHRDSGYDLVVHLAAESRVQPSFDNPLTVHDTNTTGTIKLLEVARLNGARFVFASSSCVCGDVYKNPYAISKSVGEDYCHLYSRVYGVRTTIARLFNVYGPRQMDSGRYATVLGIFERQRREGVPLTVTGDGSQERDFVSVLDVVEALVELGTENHTGIAEIGSGQSVSVLEIARLFDHPIRFVERPPGEMDYTQADLPTWMKWRPKHSVRDWVKSLPREVTCGTV